MKLHGLVADIECSGPVTRYRKPLCFSFIPTAQGGGVMRILQQFHKVFHHRGFPGTAGGQVTNADNGEIEGCRFQDLLIKKKIAQQYKCTVQQGKWEKQVSETL